MAAGDNTSMGVPHLSRFVTDGRGPSWNGPMRAPNGNDILVCDALSLVRVFYSANIDWIRNGQWDQSLPAYFRQDMRPLTLAQCGTAPRGSSSASGVRALKSTWYCVACIDLLEFLFGFVCFVFVQSTNP